MGVDYPDSALGAGRSSFSRIDRSRHTEEKGRTRHCTEWRPREAVGQFGSHGGAAIGELIVGPFAHRAMKTVIAYAPVVIGIRVLVVLLVGALVGIPIV